MLGRDCSAGTQARRLSRQRGEGDKDKPDFSQAVHFSGRSLLNCSYFIFLNAAACLIRAG